MLQLITAPTELPISVETVKQHLRVDHADDDELIEGYIRAAVDMIDGKSTFNLALMPQQWEWSLDNFPSPGPLYLPLKPVRSIESINYLNADNDLVEVDAAVYSLKTGTYPARLYLAHDQEWPSPLLGRDDAVRILFNAGWPLSDDSPPAPTVPEALLQAIKLMVGDMYEWRETAVVGTIFTPTDIPTAAVNLIQRHRMYL